MTAAETRAQTLPHDAPDSAQKVAQQFRKRSAPEVEAGAHLVLVDDEPGLRQTLRIALEREGYCVDVYADGAEAWGALRESTAPLPQLAILDILMPRMDGLEELCRKLRSRSETLPIVFLSSRDDEFDRVLGLEIGADDYLGKPFSMRELAARVKVLLRRAARERTPAASALDEDSGDRLTLGALSLDSDRYRATWSDVEIPLTVTEFLILRALVHRPGFVKTREQLMHEGYAHDAFVSERTIDSHVKRIRRKFEAADPGFGAVETVHGLGYRYRDSQPTGTAA